MTTDPVVIASFVRTPAGSVRGAGQARARQAVALATEALAAGPAQATRGGETRTGRDGRSHADRGAHRRVAVEPARRRPACG